MSKFEINVHKLDKECIEHPILVEAAHRRLSTAKFQLETLKQDIADRKSKLEAIIRAKPKKFDIVKLTEGAVLAALSQDSKLQEMKGNIIPLQYEIDEAWADVHACSARGTSLENLVKLYGFNYFDTPRVTSEGVDKINKAKRSRGGVRPT